METNLKKTCRYIYQIDSRKIHDNMYLRLGKNTLHPNRNLELYVHIYLRKFSSFSLDFCFVPNHWEQQLSAYFVVSPKSTFWKSNLSNLTVLTCWMMYNDWWTVSLCSSLYAMKMHREVGWFSKCLPHCVRRIDNTKNWQT